jgi:hypothetical protein
VRRIAGDEEALRSIATSDEGETCRPFGNAEDLVIEGAASGEFD